MKRGLLIISILVLCARISYAAQPDEMLSDPALEARARIISRDLRCPVCQNQSIDDSDADLAHDLRLLVRQRLKKGDSDAQVKKYLVERYGDYVLLDPPFKAATYVLWLGPLFFLLCAAFTARLFLRIKAEPLKPLTEKEQKRLISLLHGEKK